jgi:CheY-like chemotaxis protein
MKEIAKMPPLVEEATTPKPTDRPSELRTLLVEDEQMNVSLTQSITVNCHAPRCQVMIMKTMLNSGPCKDLHIKLQAVSTAEAALRLVAAESFDLIICDEHMEGAGGVLLGSAAIKLMRQRGVTAKIISCSGNCSADDALRYADAGADTMVRGPLCAWRCASLGYSPYASRWHPMMHSGTSPSQRQSKCTRT